MLRNDVLYKQILEKLCEIILCVFGSVQAATVPGFHGD